MKDFIKINICVKLDLVVKVVKNMPAMQETLGWFWVSKIPWTRNRLPTPVFLGVPVAQLIKIHLQCGSSGLDPWIGKIPWRREQLPRFRKYRGMRDQIANIHWIIEKTKEFQKSIYFCFTDYAKSFSYVDHNKLGKVL